MAEEHATLRPQIVGNDLFQKAVGAMVVDVSAAALMLQTVLRAVGVVPLEVTRDDLGMLLPEIERRLRQLAPPETAAQALKRLRTLLLDLNS